MKTVKIVNDTIVDIADLPYIIESIEEKRPDYHNKVYNDIIKQPCVIRFAEVNKRGIISCEPSSYPGELHRIITTTILRICIFDDGNVDLETENSIYHLLTKENYKKGCPHDLFRQRSND